MRAPGLDRPPAPRERKDATRRRFPSPAALAAALAAALVLLGAAPAVPADDGRTAALSPAPMWQAADPPAATPSATSSSAAASPSSEPQPAMAGEAVPGEPPQPAAAERVGPHPLADGTTDPAPAEEAAPPAPAAAAPPKPPAADAGPQIPTAEQIAAKLAQVKAAAEADPPTDGLTPEQRTAMLADLAAAAEARKLLDAVAATRLAAEAAAEGIEEEAKALQAELDALARTPSPDEFKQSFKELTDAAVVADQAKAENEKVRLTREKENLAAVVPNERRDADQAALRAALKRKTEAAAAAEALNADTPTEVSFVKIARARLERAAAAEALAAAEADARRAAAAAAVGLPKLKRTLAERRIAAADARVDAAEAELDRRAVEKARELAAESAGAGEVPPSLRPLALQVEELREALEKQTSKKISAGLRVDRTGERLAELKTRWERVAEDVELLGLSDAVSAILRRARPELPNVEKLGLAIEARYDEINEAILAAADRRNAFNALPAEADHYATALTLLKPEEQRGLSRDAFNAAATQATELLTLRRKLLTALVVGDGAEPLDQAVLDELKALQAIQQEYRDTVSAFAEYIDERVLWVRSGPGLNKEQLEAELPLIAGWAGPDGVRATLRSVAGALAKAFGSPLLLLGLVACAGLGVVRLRLRGLLALWATPSRRKGSMTFQPTAAAFVATLLAAAAAPAALAWLAAALTDAPVPNVDPRTDGTLLPPFLTAAAFGTAAAYTAAVWFPLALLRGATRRDGLADAHFLWPSGAVRRIQRQARWFTPPLLSAVAIAGLLGSNDPQHAGGGWERVAFAAACVMTALLFYRLLRPAGVVWDGIRQAAPESPSYRLRVPICMLTVAGAAALGGLSLFGYHYTAGELARRGLETAALLIGLVLLRCVAIRWVTVSRRAMLYRGMQRRREEAAAREQAADPSLPAAAPAEAPPAAAPDSPGANAAELSGQTRTLVTASALMLAAVGLYFVWADVLPALNKLEDVTIASWKVTREVPLDVPAVEGTDGLPGADAVKTELKEMPISLWDLLVAAAAAGLTVLAAKNLPGLLALSVFDRLPLDAGGRYAVSRLAGYVAVVVGVLFTAGRLGFEWENVQWLIAALTVGLGFGLQEIVANFVCGVIILFERPVRVGDVVTVDDITGVVSRIRIRATTITNWDRKEFIVPNKEFVTGRLLNWTLSDATNRIVIEVGVAYGSDTQKARDLLLEAAAEAPLVMKDPVPLATFEGFGDSTLNLILRCYLPSLDQRLPVISELHAAIDRKFRAAEIEIAFPQRDLHVRSVPAALAALPASREASPDRGPEVHRGGDRVAA